MDDLVAFLRARLDERAARAMAAAECVDGAAWTAGDPDLAEDVTTAEGSRPVAVGPYESTLRWELREFIADNDPARVLAEVQAKRRIVEGYERKLENRRAHPDDLASAGALLALHGTVKLLALPYADHPSYRPEWRP